MRITCGKVKSEIAISTNPVKRNIIAQIIGLPVLNTINPLQFYGTIVSLIRINSSIACSQSQITVRVAAKHAKYC